MVLKNKVNIAVLSVSLLAFLLFVIYILHYNQEVFYTVHNHSEFLYGSPFFNTLMSKPFGIMQYIGAWLTQLFSRPSLGAGVLALIWVLIFIIGAKAFKLKNSASALMLLPIACLVISVVDLGYWVYVCPIRGYWFSQSVTYLIMLLLLWIARCTPRKWHIIWYLLAFAFYPLIGWFAMLFVLCLALIEKPTWRELIGVVLLFFTAGIWHNLLYSNIKIDDVIFAGLPQFITPSDETKHLSYPFWTLGVFSIAIPLCGRYLNRWYVPVLSVIVAIVCTWSLMYRNNNYINEMRMVRNAENDNWKEILNIASENKSPTLSMVMLKNVALMHEGGLLDKSFKIGNDYVGLYNPDSLHVSFLEIASPIVYYNYGLINEAIRLNFECAVQSGFSPFFLKSLSRSTLATGEVEQSEHYATVLRHIPFYSNWQPAPAVKKTTELQKSYADELTGVENTAGYLTNSISMWCKSDNKLVSEQALFYSMIRCDSHRFWPALRNFLELHEGEMFPLHAQEAYIMYIDKAPEKKRMMVPVEQPVYNRYKQFWSDLEGLANSGLDKKDIKVRMQKGYGDTYWYYNVFGNKII